jgi:hypothetical protein
MRRLLLLPVLLVLLAAAAPPAAMAQVVDTPPTASTRAATPIGVTTATLRGVIDPNGQSTSYRFEYGTTTAYGLQTADSSAGAGEDPVAVNAPLSSLTEDTVYHYRVIAWPDADPSAVVVGGDRSLHTIAPPGVSSNSPRNTRPDGTTLDGKVDPNRSATSVYFEWGTTSDYGAQTPAVSIGGGSTRVEVPAPLDGLTPHSTYHYRIVATNAAGTTRGRDRAFTTLRLPTGIVLSQTTLNVGFGGATTIDGQVQGIGVDHIRVALAGTPFPFAAPFTSAGDLVRTEADGSFHLVTRPLLTSTRLHVVTASDPPVVSPDVTVFTRLLVGATAFKQDRRRYRITGTVTPDVRGARVSLQRQVGSKWVAAKRTRTKRMARGRVGYSVVVTRARKARRYRVVVTPRSAAYARSESRSVKIPRR